MADLKPLPKPVSLSKPSRKNIKERKQPVSVSSRVRERNAENAVVTVAPEREQLSAPREPAQAKKKSIKSRIGLPKNINPKNIRIPDNIKAQRVKVRANAKKAYGVMRRYVRFGIAAISLAAAAFVFMFIWSLAASNVFAVYVDGQRIGYIEYDENINTGMITAEVHSRVEASEQMRVILRDEIILNEVSGRGRNALPVPEIAEQLASVINFQLVGTAIDVDGYRVAVLRTRDDAEQVIWSMQYPFLRGRSREDFYTVEFMENLVLTDIPIENENLFSVHDTLNILDNTTTFMEAYVVQDGDTISGIALRHGTTQDQIFYDNPGLSENIHPGDVVSIQIERPFLSVRTVESVTREEIIPLTNTYLENPGRAYGTEEIIEEGRNGLREVVEHIVRINGIQMGPAQEITSRILEEAVPNLVEVGTMQ